MLRNIIHEDLPEVGMSKSDILDTVVPNSTSSSDSAWTSENPDYRDVITWANRKLPPCDTS